MKKLIGLLFVAIFSFVIMTAAAPTVFGQKLVKRCYYTSTTVRRVVPKGCNSCQRLLWVEERIKILESKKPEERTPVDLSELTKLRSEFDDLVKRVEKLESEMKQARTDIDELRTDLNTTNVKVDGIDNRVGTLEKECKVLRMTDKKGKTRSYDSCTNKEINTGMSTTAKVLIGTGVATGVTAVIVCVIFKKCGGSGGGNLPPIVNTH